jgi:hypothetical protein
MFSVSKKECDIHLQCIKCCYYYFLYFSDIVSEFSTPSGIYEYDLFCKIHQRLWKFTLTSYMETHMVYICFWVVCHISSHGWRPRSLYNFCQNHYWIVPICIYIYIWEKYRYIYIKAINNECWRNHSINILHKSYRSLHLHIFIFCFATL